MPGHYITDEQIDVTYKDLQVIEEEIKNHDVLLNCFDSREARYFPSLIGALHNKLVLSIGIGYDSFVIVRHGKYGEDFGENLEKCLKDPTQEDYLKDLNKNDIGCFFCSDYLPPNDTMSNRTLDQQCTVSRPGISMVSCGIGVEMIVNALHDGKIGKNLHFVRGVFGSNFEFVSYENSRYENCTACSKNVIKEYLNDKKGFMTNILNNPQILNKFSGFDANMEDFDEEELDGIIVIDTPLISFKKRHDKTEENQEETKKED